MITRVKPKLPYCGLTVILSNSSRFDLKQNSLLTSTGGLYFNECLGTFANRYMCDIRTVECKDEFLPDTKCLFVLGQTALHSIAKCDTTINEQRGSPIIHKSSNIPIISSYSPQDAVEIRNLENEFNPYLIQQGIESASEDSDSDSSAVNEKKHHGRTSRKNYCFWFNKDVEKAVKIVKNDGRLPKDYEHEPRYIIYPSSDDVIYLLTVTKNRSLYFDIETDTDLNITCFSFAFDFDSVYVVPVITHTYSHAYNNLPQIFRALAIAIRDNILVTHNGSGFDYIVLGHKYRIPINKVYDTMLAQNRIYPEAEKSLGHSLSLPWLFQPYHKDEGSFAYGNQAQALQLWRYCGKDVSSLILLKKAQDDYAKKHIGLASSIAHVNSYVRSYTTTTLLGIRYNQESMEQTMLNNDRLMNQYLRMLKILIGEKYLIKIRGSGKSSMPGSNKQCVKYFHELLSYPAVGPRTKEGEPSLAKKNMFMLKLKFSNPVIDVIIAYRRLAHASGMLKFIPFKVQ